MKKEMLYEGKAKKVWLTDNEDQLIVDYKDDATAFNGLKKGSIENKGVVNNRMTNLLLQMLEKKGVPTIFRSSATARPLSKRWRLFPLR